MDSQQYSTKSIDHLGLVSGFCKEIGLAELIDSKLPKEQVNVKISHGELVFAMILNGLGFIGRTLHMFPQYFETKPIERLIGPHLKPKFINDDALGRCLDKLYEHGVSELYQDISEKVAKHLNLKCEGLHLDSTSFHVDGRYEEDGEETGHIKLTKGYSRDHRPELNQVILNLMTENQAGIPLYMQACSGNTNDTQSFKKLVKSHIKSLKAAHNNRYLVADSSLYCAETIQSLEEQNQLFITRVPQKLKEAKIAIDEIKRLDFKEMKQGYQGAFINSHYGQVQQKWLIVKSQEAKEREEKTFKKQLTKETEKELKSFKKLCQKTFSCKEDAIEAFKQWESKQSFVQVSQMVLTTGQKYANSGRPKSGDKGTTLYQIRGDAYSCLNKVNEGLFKKGIFILGTNDCSNRLSMQKMLDIYKSQQKVEKGFRFLKSPDFLTSSLYLKNPQRIESLLMVMTCCLTVYAGLEHQIREQLKEQNTYFPDMKNKPCQNPTARWVFQCFIGITELTIAEVDQKVLNIKNTHLAIINTLGPPYAKIYS